MDAVDKNTRPLCRSDNDKAIRSIHDMWEHEVTHCSIVGGDLKFCRTGFAEQTPFRVGDPDAGEICIAYDPIAFAGIFGAQLELTKSFEHRMPQGSARGFVCIVYLSREHRLHADHCLWRSFGWADLIKTFQTIEQLLRSCLIKPGPRPFLGKPARHQPTHRPQELQDHLRLWTLCIRQSETRRS